MYTHQIGLLAKIKFILEDLVYQTIGSGSAIFLIAVTIYHSLLMVIANSKSNY